MTKADKTLGEALVEQFVPSVEGDLIRGRAVRSLWLLWEEGHGADLVGVFTSKGAAIAAARPLRAVVEEWEADVLTSRIEALSCHYLH